MSPEIHRAISYFASRVHDVDRYHLSKFMQRTGPGDASNIDGGAACEARIVIEQAQLPTETFQEPGPDPIEFGVAHA